MRTLDAIICVPAEVFKAGRYLLTDRIDIVALPEVAWRDTPPPIERDHLRRAAEMINSAQRPIFLIGADLIAAEASGDLLQLMEKASLPAAATLSWPRCDSK